MQYDTVAISKEKPSAKAPKARASKDAAWTDVGNLVICYKAVPVQFTTEAIRFWIGWSNEQGPRLLVKKFLYNSFSKFLTNEGPVISKRVS